MVSVSLAGLTCRVNPYSRLPGVLGSSSSPRRGPGAPFFCGIPGALDPLWAPQGGSRGRAATPEADETRLDRRAGTLRIVALSKVRGRL